MPALALKKFNALAFVFAFALALLRQSLAQAQQQSSPRDGGIDLAFQTRTGKGASDRVHCATLAADGSGKILLGGWFTSFDGQERWRLARIFPDGRLDESFDAGDGPGTEPIQALAALPDGGAVVVGAFRRFAESSRRLVARLRADGSLDERFDATRALAAALPVPPPRNRRARSRLGELSGPPAAENKPVDGLRAVALFPPDRVLVAGEFADGAGHLLCLDLATGAADPDFHAPEIPAGGSIESVVLQPDGKILIAGRFELVAGQTRARVARLERDGRLDPTFRPEAGGADGVVLGVATAEGGYIWVWGEFTQFGGQPRRGLARLEPDGKLDRAFDPGAGANEKVEAVLEGPNGALLVTGQFSEFNGVRRNGIVRLKANGAPDPSFDAGAGAMLGFQPEDPGDADDDPPGVSVIVPLAGGDVLVAGRFDLFNAVPAHNLARLKVRAAAE